MRFSLKWILAGTVYVAIISAAFSRGEWWYADALWAVNLLAVVYASTVAIFARGQQRAVAVAFLLAVACFALCIFQGRASLNFARYLVAAGVGRHAQVEWFAYPPGATEQISVPNIAAVVFQQL